MDGDYEAGDGGTSDGDNVNEKYGADDARTGSVEETRDIYAEDVSDDQALSDA